MITTMPAEMAERLPAIRQKWIEIGLSTAPIARPTIEAALSKMYSAVGKARPKFVVLLRSPQEVLYALAILRSKSANEFFRDQVRAQVRAQVRDQVSDQVSAQVRDQVRAQVRDQVSDQVSDQVRAQVSAQVRAQVLDQVLAQVRAQVRDQVRAQVSAQVRAQVLDQVLAQVRAQVLDQVSAQVSDQVRAQVLDQVSAQVRDQVRAQVRDQVSDQVSDQVRAQLLEALNSWWWDFGQFDAYWCSYYDTMRELGINVSALDGAMEFTREAGYSLLFWDYALVSERPAVIYRDDRNRLHCDTGPAVAYADGFAVYAIHGVRVPADVITDPASITTTRIQRETNTEIRRVMIERYGLDRYLMDSGAQEISSDDYGVLYRKEILGDEPLVMVKVVNSTPEPDGSFKDYFLRVPPTVTTAREAVAWTFGMTSADYAPAVQT